MSRAIFHEDEDASSVAIAKFKAEFTRRRAWAVPGAAVPAYIRHVDAFRDMTDEGFGPEHILVEWSPFYEADDPAASQPHAPLPATFEGFDVRFDKTLEGPPTKIELVLQEFVEKYAEGAVGVIMGGNWQPIELSAVTIVDEIVPQSGVESGTGGKALSVLWVRPIHQVGHEHFVIFPLMFRACGGEYPVYYEPLGTAKTQHIGQ